jgi:hypothetical protein
MVGATVAAAMDTAAEPMQVAELMLAEHVDMPADHVVRHRQPAAAIVAAEHAVDTAAAAAI